MGTSQIVLPKADMVAGLGFRPPVKRDYALLSPITQSVGLCHHPKFLGARRLVSTGSSA